MVKFFIALVSEVELVPIVPNWMYATQERHKWYADRKRWSLEVEAVKQVILRVPKLQALEERSIQKVDSGVHRQYKINRRIDSVT